MRKCVASTFQRFGVQHTTHESRLRNYLLLLMRFVGWGGLFLPFSTRLPQSRLRFVYFFLSFGHRVVVPSLVRASVVNQSSVSQPLMYTFCLHMLYSLSPQYGRTFLCGLEGNSSKSLNMADIDVMYWNATSFFFPRHA